MKKLYGVGVALVTPMKNNGSIDFDGLKKLLHHTANQGVDYYVVLGTTGETATLSLEEKATVLNFVKENNSAELPIVYGLGGNSTQAIIDEINKTDLKGVDAILSVSPYYNKPSQHGIISHYEAIADKCPVPVILYNVPGRTGSNITGETSLKLADHPNIIGIKEASGNLEQAMRIMKGKPEDFLLISGDDLLTLPLISIGAVGVISVIANPFGNIFHKIFEYTAIGRYSDAQKEAFKLLEINPKMYSEGNPVGVKEALKVLGVCDHHVRLPMMAASKKLQKEIAEVVKRL